MITVKNMEINPDTERIEIGGKLIHFTRKEMAILELLYKNLNETITKARFFAHVYSSWGYGVPEPKILDVFICKIRKKIKEAGGPDCIRTVWGRGYLFEKEMGK